MTQCDVKRCRQESTLVYYGRCICEKHWQLHCREDEKRFDLKAHFGIRDRVSKPKPAPVAVEERQQPPNLREV